MNSSRIFACLSALALLGACTKDNPAGPGASGEAALTGAKWKLVANTIDPGLDMEGDGTLVTDLFAESDACNRDDFTAYSADHAFTIDHGPEKCDESETQTETGTWSLNAAGDVLTLKRLGQSQSMKVVEAGPSKLVVSQTLPFPDGKSHTLTMTYAPL